MFLFSIFLLDLRKFTQKKDKEFGKNWLELASLKIDNKEN
ncbi:hypothetical protein RV11_GL000992 [Enterococcus phoeniculicola]|nr:hypothetical protein RV11_GL000992 [Enterococcus phoeniculicola]